MQTPRTIEQANKMYYIYIYYTEVENNCHVSPPFREFSLIFPAASLLHDVPLTHRSMLPLWHTRHRQNYLLRHVSP